MAEITEFGKAVKIRLIEMGKTQNWLIEQVKERTGLYFDSSYMYKITTGKLETPSIVGAIRETLGMKEERA